MRIERNQIIAGHPAVEIRRLMRDYLDRPVRIERLANLPACSLLASASTLKALEREGFLERVGNVLKPSLKGSALAQASAAPPLCRSTAERLVSQVVDRATSINSADIFAYRVRTLVIFGSFLTGADRINDVDVACELVPRWNGEEQDEAEQFSRSLHEGRFRNASESAAWPNSKYCNTSSRDPVAFPFKN